MKCEKCGNELEQGATFCNKCGNQVAKNEVVESVEKPKKKGFKIALVILLLIIFLGIGIGVGLLIGKNRDKCDAPSSSFSEKKKDEKEEKEDKKDEKKDTGIAEKKHEKLDVTKIKTAGEDELGKKIEITKLYYPESGHDLYVLAKNNNTVPVSYTFYLNYLDAKGTRLDRNMGMGYVEPGKTFVVKINNATQDDFNSVSVTTSASAYKSYYHSIDVDKKVTFQESSNGITASYKNDTDKEVSVYMSIVYYKNNEIVFFDSAYLSAKSGLTETGNFYFYNYPGYTYDKSPSEYYDKYEATVDAGFSYDKEY